MQLENICTRLDGFLVTFPLHLTFAKPLSAATSTPADENPGALILKVDKIVEIYMMCVNNQETRVNIWATIGDLSKLNLLKGPCRLSEEIKKGNPHGEELQ